MGKFKDLFIKSGDGADGAVAPKTTTPGTTSRASGTGVPLPPPPSAQARTSYLSGTTRPATRMSSASISGSASPAAPVIDPRFDAALKEALSRATMPGYQELLDQLEVLQDAIPDENIRIKTALKALARSFSLSSTQVAQAVTERLHILDQEKQEFEGNISDEARENVAANTQTITELESRIDAINRQIAQLTSERERLTGEQTEAQRQVDNVEHEVAALKGAFESTWKVHRERLQSLLTTIQPHVG